MISLQVWRVPPRHVPQMLWRVARDPARLRRRPGLRFAKLLGTGAHDDLGPGSADLTRWAALIDSGETGVGYHNDLATEHCRLILTPVAVRGSWAGWAPAPTATPPASGPVLVLTHARLRPGRAVSFWRASAETARAARDAKGLIGALGIGEAPIGWQGTVSLWETPADLVEFAYHHPTHRRAIARRRDEGWFAEEIFARFVVDEITGDRHLLGRRGAA